MAKIKIIIAGIGGVGGYFGGLLAKRFYESDNIEIYFLARGKHLKEIQKNGLKIIKGEIEFIAKPHLATDNPAEIGIADFIVIATKSYDLENIIDQLRPCIHAKTILLPLLNGVDSRERILNMLPENVVLEGCVYIVSRLKQAGVIENSGNIQKLFFGMDNFVEERLIFLEKLFKEANIEAQLSTDISSIIWEKFIFISPTATATSYFDNCIGELIADEEKFKTINILIEEVKQIAKAKLINLSNDITEQTLNKLKALPFQTTSSMHTDFQNNKAVNELKSLTEYVITEGKRYKLETPIYVKSFTSLLKKVQD